MTGQLLFVDQRTAIRSSTMGGTSVIDRTEIAALVAGIKDDIDDLMQIRRLFFRGFGDADKGKNRSALPVARPSRLIHIEDGFGTVFAHFEPRGKQTCPCGEIAAGDIILIGNRFHCKYPFYS